MRQNAVSNQPAKLLSRFSSIGSNKVLPQVMKNRTDDAKKTHPDASPVLIGSLRGLSPRSSRAMTAEGFKRKYTGGTGRIGIAGKTPVSRQGTFLGSTLTRSRFSPSPYSEDGNGSEFVREELKNSHSLGKDKEFWGESIEELEMPAPNVLEEMQIKIKNSRNVGSLPKIKESQHEKNSPETGVSLRRIEESKREKNSPKTGGSLPRIEESEREIKAPITGCSLPRIEESEREIKAPRTVGLLPRIEEK